jgi:alpha-N-arabinofuranosidase
MIIEPVFLSRVQAVQPISARESPMIPPRIGVLPTVLAFLQLTGFLCPGQDRSRDAVDRPALPGPGMWVSAARPANGSGSLPRKTLNNPDFRAKLEGWVVQSYGARPVIEVDARMLRARKPSLRVSADRLSDTALAQEVMLKPGGFYRLRGWIRTRSLDPHGSPVYGTLQVQHPGGRGIIASGTNHGGNSDWTEVTVFFPAPAGGRTRISLFFVGFGKGTGTVWFNSLALEPIDLEKAPLKVTHHFLGPATISPLHYGQFMEYLCDLIPGMWAEKLYDGSFEGLSPYKFAFRKEMDFREKPWYPSGAVNRAEYVRDPHNPVSGDLAQKIAVGPDAPCTVGISQDGIAVRRGLACRFACYLRGQRLGSSVRVCLHREGKALAACEFRPTDGWKKYQGQLVPSRTESNATLTISFRGPGTLWLDNASLMPKDAIGGWRADVVAAVRALKPGVIRFGGSALDEPGFGDFDWRDTVGDPDRRKPFRAWGGLQPTGPGLEEIVQFCRAVGAEPLLCVRFTGRKPQDAADEVQYFNGAATTPQGKRRAQNGHPEPYRVRYWQVGNERAGSDYEARLAAFARAMKAVDPGIKLLSSYPSAGVLRQAGDQIDYVCPHHYDCGNLVLTAADLAAVEALLYKHARRRPVKVAVTEWNTTAGDWGLGRAKLWTLANALACARYHNLLHRRAPLVEIANRSNLTNSFCSGILQTDNHRLYKTPTYYAQQLYATRAGNRPLRVDSPVPADVGVDVSATLSPRGDRVILLVVNDTLTDIVRPLDFSAFGNRGQDLSIWTLADRDKTGEPDVTNGFGDPARVAIVASKFRAPSARFEYRLPALSLTVLEWMIAGR